MLLKKQKLIRKAIKILWIYKRKYGITIGQVQKLVPTLSNKEKYVLHYRNLQLYLDVGLKLKKVHHVLEFNQSSWLKQYIYFNTQKRTNAKNSFEKDFTSLWIIQYLVKRENIHKRVDVKPVTDEQKIFKLAPKPTYVNSKIFNGNLVVVYKI